MTSDLEEFALRPWGHQRRGIVVDRTPERLLEALPNFAIAGPNHVCLVRTRAERVPALLAEARAFFGAHQVPYAWILDPGVEPPDLEQLLLAHGLRLLEELTVMVLPAAVDLEAPAPGITFLDGLRDFDSFRIAAEIQAAAFGGGVPPGLEARWEEIEPGQNRHLVIACAGGVPAATGWAWVTPRGTQLNAGASLPEFRGRGLYRATVWERWRLARAAGSPGLTVQAASASQPILERLGFRRVGNWRLFA
ncbi:MAG TPA: hypothetical protein VF160_10595 [Candidatus Dormibacteraeota bacterium]